jgi:hypothetical protein
VKSVFPKFKPAIVNSVPPETGKFWICWLPLYPETEITGVSKVKPIFLVPTIAATVTTTGEPAAGASAGFGRHWMELDEIQMLEQDSPAECVSL